MGPPVADVGDGEDLGPVAVGDDRPVVSTHSVRQALELAEEFSRELHKRHPASGFIKTLLQRRVGSSVLAGLNTANRMLEEREVEDEDGMNEEGESIYPLTTEEREMLVRLRDQLTRQTQAEGDPKFDRILEVLRSKFEATTWPWWDCEPVLQPKGQAR